MARMESCPEKLAERESAEPVPAVEAPRAGVATVAGPDRFELSSWDELNNLGKDGRGGHRLEPLVGKKTFSTNASYPWISGPFNSYTMVRAGQPFE
jgi:hypothetical protein